MNLKNLYDNSKGIEDILSTLIWVADSREGTLSNLYYKNDNFENTLRTIVNITATSYLNHKERLILIHEYARKMIISCDENPDTDVSECSCEDCQRFHKETELVGRRLMNQQYEVVPCNPEKPTGCITTHFIGDSEIRESFMNRSCQKIIKKIKKEPERSTLLP